MVETKQTTPVPPIDLAAERAELGAAVSEAVERVLASGQYILGPDVKALEAEFAAAQGAQYGVGLASGTDALILGLRALGVMPGDHVVTTPFTFFASAGAIAWVGAVPRLADVDPDTALLTPESAAEAIDRRTSCLLPVHLYGQLADVRGFRALADEHKLALLEDGAQAHGARRGDDLCGTLGDAAAFSFYPTKNLGAPGDAGMVLSNRAEVDARLRALRDHGSAQKYVHASIGTNSRLASIPAAVLRLKLAHLEEWNDRRRHTADLYDAAFAGSDLVRPLARVPEGLHAFHQYTIRIGAGRRDAVLARLHEAGIGAGVHYPRPVHLQEAAAPWGYREGDFPHAEALAREVICLPIHPFLSAADAERVAATTLEAAQG